jgi:hypothetical protein
MLHFFRKEDAFSMRIDFSRHPPTSPMHIILAIRTFVPDNISPSHGKPFKYCSNIRCPCRLRRTRLLTSCVPITFLWTIFCMEDLWTVSPYLHRATTEPSGNSSFRTAVLCRGADTGASHAVYTVPLLFYKSHERNTCKNGDNFGVRLSRTRRAGTNSAGEWEHGGVDPAVAARDVAAYKEQMHRRVLASRVL